MMWDESHERMVVRAARGFQPRDDGAMSLRRARATWGGSLLSGEASHRRGHARWTPQLRSDITDAEGIRAFIHVPIKIGEDSLWRLQRGLAEPRAFGEDEQRLFIALAQRAVPGDPERAAL